MKLVFWVTAGSISSGTFGKLPTGQFSPTFSQSKLFLRWPGGILVTENGCAVADDDVKVAKKDTFRVEFLQGWPDSRAGGLRFWELGRGLFACSKNCFCRLPPAQVIGLVFRRDRSLGSSFWFVPLGALFQEVPLVVPCEIQSWARGASFRTGLTWAER